MAARQLELAARLVTGTYLRAARAGRMGWQEIGAWFVFKGGVRLAAVVAAWTHDS